MRRPFGNGPSGPIIALDLSAVILFFSFAVTPLPSRFANYDLFSSLSNVSWQVDSRPLHRGALYPRRHSLPDVACSTNGIS